VLEGRGRGDAHGSLHALALNDPELIVLDEPTDGVDVQGRRDVRDVLPEIQVDLQQVRGGTLFHLVRHRPGADFDGQHFSGIHQAAGRWIFT